MKKYENLTDDRFDEILVTLVNQSPASYLLSIPGVYELVAEEYNNEVLEHYEQSIETGE